MCDFLLSRGNIFSAVFDFFLVFQNIKIHMSERDTNLTNEELKNAKTIRANTEADSIENSNEVSSDDDYVLSDQDNSTIDGTNNNLDSQFHDPSSLSNHAKYFSNTILLSLDSSDVDRALVLEAQISGNLNNETQKLLDKTNLLHAKLVTIQSLCDTYFAAKDNSKLSRVERLRNEIRGIEKRLQRLKHGDRKSFPASLIKSQKSGVIEEYPVEYFQARDKVLERIQE